MITHGLSPRVRGSLRALDAEICSIRSIPASAGQPLQKTLKKRKKSVYPRECGAALDRLLLTPERLGLSPRVRGSRVESVGRNVWVGSIPASAGQPIDECPMRRILQVYPRECGAASVSSASSVR